MYDYGEICPMSKATSLLCERWTLQIIREMFLGASRFSEFQKYLPKISPSLLNARLRVLVENGIAIRKRIPEKRGFEYHLTPAGKSLAPLLTEFGTWGKTWVYGKLTDEELDLEGILRAIAEMIDTDQLPDCDTVLQFTFTDLDENPKWFVTIKDGKREICDTNLGHEVDVYFRSTLKTLDEIWWGQMNLIAACESEQLKVTGPPVYTRNLSRWFPANAFDGCSPRP
jgi:DNA-binding HxlR family transcriptional regulator